MTDSPETAGTPANDTHTPDDLTVPWSVVAVCMVLFPGLAFLTAGTNTLRIDETVTGWVQGFEGQIARRAAEVGNVIGESIYAAVFLVVALGATLLLRRWRDLWFLIVAALLRTAVTGLKGIIESPRPLADQAIPHELFDGFGFPSGHVTTSAVLTGTLAFLVARQFPNRAVGTSMLALWILGMALTSYARIWLGAHWFTDTVGGALVGIAIILVAANTSPIVTRRLQPTTYTPPGQTRAR